MQLSDKELFRQQCYVNGEWIPSASGSTIEVTNPYDGSVIGAIPSMSREEAASAIEKSAKAFKDWKKKTPVERADVMLRWYHLILENIDDLARILTIEQGKPLAESRAEITVGAGYIRWYAEEGRRVYGDVIPSPWPDKQPLTTKQAVGPVGAITPWNFPMSMITRKAAPALAAGCSIVLKPASATPFSALALAELAGRAGVPAGVFNVITGKASELGQELCENPLIRKITFTGSTAVGKELISQCASTVKKVSMELGGNAPFIVCPDADLDAASQLATAGRFRNSGQTCVCPDRFIVHESVYGSFVAKFRERVEQLKQGNGLEDGIALGPLIDANALDKMKKFVADAKDKGAKVMLGGEDSKLGGQFYPPTVLTEVTRDMLVFKEEIFGPIAPVIAYSFEEEAIEMANDTEYGLAAYVCTRDMGSAHRIASGLDFGMVGVNDVGISTPETPFGGMKESGLGRESGREGIQDFLETKFILFGGLGK